MGQESKSTPEIAEGLKEAIRTKLKFVKSDLNGALISFISQNPVTGAIRGVRQDSPYPKKIVLVDRSLSGYLVEEVLYDCLLAPTEPVLNEKTGKMYIPRYTAIEATPVKFKASVSTLYARGMMYRINISFGNQCIRFDPFRGRKESVKTIPACVAVLEKRCDIENLSEVIDDFVESANALLKLKKEDMREIHCKKRPKAGNGKAVNGHRN